MKLSSTSRTPWSGDVVLDEVGRPPDGVGADRDSRCRRARRPEGLLLGCLVDRPIAARRRADLAHRQESTCTKRWSPAQRSISSHGSSGFSIGDQDGGAQARIVVEHSRAIHSLIAAHKTAAMSSLKSSWRAVQHVADRNRVPNASSACRRRAPDRCPAGPLRTRQSGRRSPARRWGSW